MTERSGLQAILGRATEGLKTFIGSASTESARRLAVLNAIDLLAGGGNEFTTREIVLVHGDLLPDCTCIIGNPGGYTEDEISASLESLRGFGVVSYNPALGKWRLSEAGRQAVTSERTNRVRGEIDKALPIILT